MSRLVEDFVSRGWRQSFRCNLQALADLVFQERLAHTIPPLISHAQFKSTWSIFLETEITKKYISLAEFQYRFYRRDAGCCELKRKLKVASAREDQRALTPARFPESTLPLVNNIRRSIFTLTGNIFPFKYNYYYFCQNQKTKKILYFSFGKKRNKTFVVVVFVF